MKNPYFRTRYRLYSKGPKGSARGRITIRVLFWSWYASIAHLHDGLVSFLTLGLLGSHTYGRCVYKREKAKMDALPDNDWETAQGRPFKD